MTKQKTKGIPSEIDVHVGNRLRVRRSLLGWSQEKLSQTIGVTFQQIQKYEKGTNRVSAGRLFEFSQALGVPVAYFYEQLPNIAQTTTTLGFSDNEQDGFETLQQDVMQKKETFNLVRAYYSIEDEDIRKDVIRMLKNMAAHGKK